MNINLFFNILNMGVFSDMLIKFEEEETDKTKGNSQNNEKFVNHDWLNKKYGTEEFYENKFGKILKDR